MQVEGLESAQMTVSSSVKDTICARRESTNPWFSLGFGPVEVRFRRRNPQNQALAENHSRPEYPNHPKLQLAGRRRSTCACNATDVPQKSPVDRKSTMSYRRHAATVSWLILISLTSTSPVRAQQPLQKSTVAFREVDGHEVLADVYRPAGSEVVPAIVWIHGGGLIMGHREGVPGRIRDIAKHQGCAIVSIDYRLAPETKLPQLISDVEAAFSWIADNGARQFHLNPQRLVVAGASAGGYLTLITGYRATPRPVALVSLFGYGDLTGDWYATPSPHPRHNNRKVTREEALQQTDGTIISDARQRSGDGGSIYLYYRQTGRWPQEVSGFSPETIEERMKPFEPIHNVTADYPPTLLMHGTSDTDVPWEQSEMMAEQFRRHDVPFEFHSIRNGEHGFGGGDPRDIDAAWQAMHEFIVRHLNDALPAIP